MVGRPPGASKKVGTPRAGRVHDDPADPVRAAGAPPILKAAAVIFNSNRNVGGGLLHGIERAGRFVAT